ncbi:tetratricopeptide repeat protein [Azospirillum canadense]|uniref:tetratricopeptide repeat protein n=1 Tax=Azospirillum canadense TaxID=403962 RepID=UPI0022263071|nr:tetratricopeptide repeat protein [Azospirillum canadense]MCW2240985.1 tetratricopeptide (TPR) repeat protein [Azospirillum canadense]
MPIVSSVDPIDFDNWRARIRRDIAVNYHYCMARALVRQGDAATAEQHLQQALALEPDSARVRFELVDVLRSLGRTTEAGTLDQAGRAVDSEYEWLGRIARAEEAHPFTPELSKNELHRTLSESTSVEIRNKAGAALAEMQLASALIAHQAGDDAAYRTHLAAAVALGSTNPQTHRCWAAVCRCEGRLTESVDAIRTALSYAEDRAWLSIAKEAIEILRANLCLQEALVLSDRLAIETPDDVHNLVTRSLILLALRRTGDAVDAAQTVRDTHPDASLAWTFLSVVQAAAGNPAAAGSAARRAAALDAEDALARIALGTALALDGQAVAGLAEIRAANRAAPLTEWGKTAEGVALLLTGDRQAAEAVVSEATLVGDSAVTRSLVHFHARLRPYTEDFLLNVYDRMGLSRPAGPDAE